MDVNCLVVLGAGFSDSTSLDAGLYKLPASEDATGLSINKAIRHIHTVQCKIFNILYYN